MKTEMYCYLEDARKKVLPPLEAFERWLDPGKTAVVCIDMARGHVGPGEVSCPVPRARTKIPAHDVFHAACRELGVPVVMVQQWERHGGIDNYHSKSPTGRLAAHYLLPLYNDDSFVVIEEHAWEGTPWLDLMVETDPERDYYVRSKKRLSGFWTTDLEFLLRQLAVENVVVTGTMTDACVINTALDAHNRDFRVIVPRDVVAGYSEEAEHAALMVISLHFGLVVDAPALLAEWYARRRRELPEQLRGVTDITEVAGTTAVAV